MRTIEQCADESWNQCIACGAARSSRFFCRGCLDSRVDEELRQDNPILHRADPTGGGGPRYPHGGGCNRKRPRSPEEIARIQAQLQWLADHPGVLERLHGHRELDGLRHLPQDSRRRTDPTSAGRFMADYGSPSRDQWVNCGSLL